MPGQHEGNIQGVPLCQKKGVQSYFHHWALQNLTLFALKTFTVISFTRGFVRSNMPHYILYVVMLGFIYLNSIRSWFGGLKGMLITVVSVLLSVCSNCFEKCTYRFEKW